MTTTMTKIKFVVKVNRGGTRAPAYVHNMDRSPIKMTSNRKLALVMGRLTADDAIVLLAAGLAGVMVTVNA